MIAAVIIWFYIAILLYLYGSAVLSGLERVLGIDTQAVIELPLTILMGIMAIAVLAMIANLFIPLGAVFMVGLLAGALVIAFRRRFLLSISFPSYHPLTWALLILVFLTVLENVTHTPSNPDTGLYHAQTIRWFESYRIVPGLGNLQERYAFNSAWLVLNASFSLAFLGLRSFHLINGILFLSGTFYFIEGLQALGQKRITYSSLLKTLFLPLSFYLVGSDISSVGNDMPVSLITWVILILWVDKFESASPAQIKNAVLFLLPVFAVTVKLSSLPLLCFSLLIMVEYLVKKDWRTISILAMLGAVIVLPWLLRSVILSGYLIFPLSQIDFFSLDWKMSASRVVIARQDIIGFARISTKASASALNMNFWQWGPIWFDRETHNRKLIYEFVLFSPLMMLVGLYKNFRQPPSGYRLAYGIMLAGSLFWFLSAPDIRFGYGFLIGTCLLALVPAIVSAILRFDKNLHIMPGLIFLLLISFQSYILWQSIEPRTLTQRWLLPADYRHSDVKACDIKGASIYCRSEGAQCYYEAFPCIPFPRPVELRGSTFQDGFRFIQEPEP